MARILRAGSQILRGSANPTLPAWALTTGVTAANVVACYQPKGAASLAVSYTNLTGNAAYNATTATAPTWDAVGGWSFLKTSSQYLDTGVVPTLGVYSMLIRFSDWTAYADTVIAGCIDANAPSQIFAWQHNGADQVVYGSGPAVAKSPQHTAGTLGIAGSVGYRNGVSDIALTAPAARTMPSIAIGGRKNNAGAIAAFATVKVQAFAVYDVTLTAGQVAAVAAAMAAL